MLLTQHLCYYTLSENRSGVTKYLTIFFLHAVLHPFAISRLLHPGAAAHWLHLCTKIIKIDQETEEL